MKKIDKFISHSFFIFSIISFLFLLIISSCKTKDPINICEDEYVGEFRLLESSSISIPYSKNLNLFFKDSIGNEKVFEFDFDNGGYYITDSPYSTPCDANSSLEKYLIANTDNYHYRIYETSPSNDLRFLISLCAIPFSLGTEIVKLSDQFIVTRFLEITPQTNNYDIALILMVNRRDLKEEEIDSFPKPIEELELQGKIFNKVYTNIDSSLYYNYELGIIAFKDQEKNHLWVLEKME